MKLNEGAGKNNIQMKEPRCTNLEYLKKRTAADPIMVKELIVLYLDQVPPILDVMNRSLSEKDWVLLRATMHKLIPSFDIVGIDQKYERMAKMVQDLSSMHDQTGQVSGIVMQLDNICRQACEELNEELINIKY
jgi:hypothetical protein